MAKLGIRSLIPTGRRLTNDLDRDRGASDLYEALTGWTRPASSVAFPVQPLPADVVERAYLNECREQEARRIAQTLHDDAGQLLSAVHIKLDHLVRELPAHQSSLQEIKSMLDQVSGGLRRLSHELRPSILDNLGLMPAIEFLADGVASRTGLAITVEGSTEGRLLPMVETALYRTVQEALTNASKHAHAQRVRIRLWRDSQIHCSIRDNGVGVNVADVLARRDKCSLGLIGMQERIEALGGTLLIASAPGKGLGLLATIPLEKSGKTN